MTIKIKQSSSYHGFNGIIKERKTLRFGTELTGYTEREFYIVIENLYGSEITHHIPIDSVRIESVESDL